MITIGLFTSIPAPAGSIDIGGLVSNTYRIGTDRFSCCLLSRGNEAMAGEPRVFLSFSVSFGGESFECDNLRDWTCGSLRKRNGARFWIMDFFGAFSYRDL